MMNMFTSFKFPPNVFLHDSSMLTHSYVIDLLSNIGIADFYFSISFKTPRYFSFFHRVASAFFGTKPDTMFIQFQSAIANINLFMTLWAFKVFSSFKLSFFCSKTFAFNGTKNLILTGCCIKSFRTYFTKYNSSIFFGCCRTSIRAKCFLSSIFFKTCRFIADWTNIHKEPLKWIVQ